MSDNAKTFQIEDARIIFRNFSGEASQYNREGDRNFAVVLDDKTATQMLKDGWNVKYLDSRDEDTPNTPYIQVSVNFKNKPPRVVMITSGPRTTLNQESIGVLDWADIRTADLIARGYDWDVNGKTGTKAYLKTLFVTIDEDELERKYALTEVEG